MAVNQVDAIVRSTSADAAQNNWTARKLEDGSIEIDLGNNRRLVAREGDSSVTLYEGAGESGRVLKIWGDPHVNTDAGDSTDFDFYGTTTFVIPGTQQQGGDLKLTVNTRPVAGSEVTFTETVSITQGEKSAVITGVSEQDRGDLRVIIGGQGRELDAKTWDGKLTAEWVNGRWQTRDAATQQYRDITWADGTNTKAASSDPRERSAQNLVDISNNVVDAERLQERMEALMRKQFEVSEVAARRDYYTSMAAKASQSASTARQI